MDLKKSEIISRLNEMANRYQQKAKDAFRLFDYDFEFSWTSHFIDRFMQRFPTYEIAEGIVDPVLEKFVDNQIHLIVSAFSGMKEYKLVNIRHPSLQKQNVLIMQIERVDNLIKITLITVYKANTSYINSNPQDYIYLHKKPRFFVPGQIGKRLLKFAQNNEVPEELKSITELWK